MPAKTDFNVSPYWDDFSIDKDFYRVLFRPGFAVQARELTQLQTILQNQIEQFGNHFFKEGTIVIPGSVAYDDKYFAVKFQSTFGGNTVSDYLTEYGPGGVVGATTYTEGAILTGATSGVTAQVIGSAVATSSDPDTLFVKYLSSNTTDNSTVTFTNDEELSADRATTNYAADVSSIQLQATTATATGSAASVTEGIFFIRGFMCRTAASTIPLDKYTNTPSYRIGFTVTEGLITPEADSSLLDNATGASNYAAKGAHRLKITLTLAKKTLTETDDSNFVELARVENGQIVHRKKATEYAVIADMIARRTEDESGDYVVKHFDIEARENLNDGTNRGIYTAAQGGVETKDTLVIAPGKAYVNGYEIEKQTASFVNIDKGRTTKSINNDSVPFNLGNYAKVKNVYGQPDITEVSTTINPFDIVKIYDKQTLSAGTAYGTNIGQARSRSFEYGSGTVGAAAAIYHHYLFDISMYTAFLLSANTTLTAKAVVTGVTSGATGIVVTAVSGAADVFLMQVEGAFQTGETLTSSVSGDSVGSGTISTITTYDFSTHAKQIFEDITTIDYTSDIVLDQSLTLTGAITTTAAGTTVTGTNTRFSTELTVGDVIQLPTGTAGITEEFRVSAIASNLSLTIEKTATGTANTTVAVTSAKAIRIRAKIAEEEETVLVYKTPKDNTKTLLVGGSSDTTYSFRKQFIGTTNASGLVTFSAATGETFDSASAGRAYTMTVNAGGSGSASAGDIIDLSSTKAGTTTVSGTGTQTLSITDNTLLGNAAAVTLMASITVGTKAQKAKTANKMTSKTIASNGTTGTKSDVFGERVIDNSISLSYADVYTLHAVYESAAIGTTPVTPTLTISDSTGTFTVGEIITGTSTGATGRVIINSPSTNIDYVVLAGTFTTNDEVTGGTSANMATVTATTTGDRNVTTNFLLDTGQRDSFYDLGRASRKPNAVLPVGQLMFLYDYFAHGAGDYFSVDSYTSQVTYADIPQYLSSKVDPESKAPIGQYELRDSLDFRPSVQNQTSPTSCPFAFENKNFEDSGASAGNLVVPDDNVRIDFDFYLGRLDILYLDQLGNFIIQAGISAEAPSYPPTDNVNMMVAKISVAPYTFKPETDILVHYQYNRRYTMRDIGKLEARVGRLEYATSLGLLERQTDSFQVLDENGFDRFKSGFMVDNFYGHNIGNTLNDDYECAMDPGLGYMRPKSIQNMVMLQEENTSDTQRTSNYYQKTGDLITLPYTHTAELTQPYASRVESVNPFSVTLWVGDLRLDPETDIWFTDERVPSVTIDVEGNYEQMLREQGGNTDLGTIWNSWNTVSTGNERSVDTGGTWNRVVGGSGSPWRQTMTNTATVVDARQERTGTNTRLVERIDRVSMGDRVVNIDIVPWMRPRNVNFTVTGLKPNTRVYAFFDKVDVNAEVKPTLTSATNTLLNGALTKTATTVTVDSTTGFPSTGTIGVGSVSTTDIFGQSFSAQEQMTYTGTTATTFTGITRNTGNMYDEPQEWADNSYVANSTYGTSLVSDSVGTLYGRFEVPQTETKRFRYGTRTFRLTDSSTDSQVVGLVETSAETPYTATGFIQTKQEVIMSVRNGQTSTTTVVPETQTVQQTIAGSQSSRAISGVWYDPLAQTVMCDQASGMFLTKVDVYFSAKDDSLPVWMEIREVKDGYPGPTIFPFGKVTKIPADVTVDSTTASSVTTFTFDSPIYINSRQEFCIVLASNSPKYKVWIARLGETEVGGTRTISTQPTLGSLFKSQNASTWTPSQYEDLKFTMYRAVFDIANTGSFVVVNEELKAQDPNSTTPAEGPIREGGGKSAGIPTLPDNPLDSSSKVISTTITVGGSGYTSSPTVAFTAPTSGVTATGTAVIAGGAVSAINITNAGEGYLTAPTISFSGGGGTLAAATATIASTSVRVRFKNHAMYSTINNVTISGAVSDKGSSTLTNALTSAATGTVAVADSTNWPTTGYVRIDDELIYYDSKPSATSISIATSGGRGYNSTTAAAHEAASIVQLYMFAGIPLTEINKIHTSISGIETDSFLITTTTAATATISGGGKGVQCTRNIPMDVMQPIIQVMELPNTTATGALQSTTGSSPSGTQTPFTRTVAASAVSVPLNEDYYYDAPQIICSQINETNELSGNKSFRLTTSLTSTDALVSPVIDTKRMGVISIANRVNNIDASTDVGALTPYHASTAFSGDNNNAIYITKKIALSQAATALQVLFDAVKMSEADIKVMYKTLRVDSAEAFDDLDWEFFNTTGIPDSTVPISKTRADFKEYKYFAGKDALGVGTELTEFIAFAIKIVQQGTNTALPSMIKDFRVIAFQA